MTSATSRRILSGLGGKAFGQGAHILTRLAEVPLFLHFWGPQLYGEWLIIAALPTYLAMSDLGFAGAANRDMAMAVARGDRDGALSSFQSSSLLILALSGGLAILFVLAMAALPIVSAFDLASTDRFTLLATVAILAAGVIVTAQRDLLFGGYYAEGRYPLGFYLLALISYANLAILAAALFLGAGLLGVACATLLAQVLGCLLMRVVAFRIAPWLRYGLARARLATASRLFAPAIAGMAFPFGAVTSAQGTRLVIGWALGPAALVMFVVHRQLARLVTIVAALVHPFQAELSTLYGAGETERFRSLSRRTFQIVGWAVLATGAGILLFGAIVFERWTRGEIEFAPLLLLILLAASALEALWRVALTPLLAINRHIEGARAYAILCVLLLPVLYVGLRLGGLEGAALVILVAEAAMLAYVLASLMRITGDGLRPWLAFVARPPLGLALATARSYRPRFMRTGG